MSIGNIIPYNQLTDFVNDGIRFGGLRVSECNQVSDQVDLSVFP